MSTPDPMPNVEQPSDETREYRDQIADLGPAAAIEPYLVRQEQLIP